MSSLYEKNGIIYITWYEKSKKKSYNRSLRMKATSANWRKAKKIKKELDKKLMSVTVPKENDVASVVTIEQTVRHFYEVNWNKKENTIKGYDLFFRLFLDGRFFRKEDPVNKINKRSVDNWLLALGRGSNYSQNTLFNYTKVLKKYLKFLVINNYIQPIILNEDAVYKPEIKEIEIFSDEEINLMFERIVSKPNNIKIVFYLLLYTGLRPTDIFDIKKKDIDFENKEIKIYSPKTRNYRIVPVVDELIEKLELLISHMGEDDRIINYANVKNMNKSIHRFLAECGIKRENITLRTFRKTFISLAYKSNIDFVTLSKIVGHKKITTTQKYYTYFDTKKQKEELKKLRIGGK